MTWAEALSLGTGLLVGAGSSTVFILALFLGFCIIAGFPKLRPTAGRKSMVVRSLDDLVGQESFATYLPASAPRGPVDVLHTYEQRGNSVK